MGLIQIFSPRPIERERFPVLSSALFLIAWLLGSFALSWAESHDHGLADTTPVPRWLSLEFGVSGQVYRVHVTEGDSVEPGQILAELNPAYYEAAAEAAALRLDRIEAEFAEANRAFERDQVLYDEGSLSAVELSHSAIIRMKSQESHAEAKAALLQAKGLLALSRIVAPINGTIFRVRTGPGENIVSGANRPASILLIPDP